LKVIQFLVKAFFFVSPCMTSLTENPQPPTKKFFASAD